MFGFSSRSLSSQLILSTRTQRLRREVTPTRGAETCASPGTVARHRGTRKIQKTASANDCFLQGVSSDRRFAEEPRLAQVGEITKIQKMQKSQTQDPSSSSTLPMPSNPQTSPSMGTTIVDMNDEDDAKRGIESANDDRANKKHRGGIVMKSGVDVSRMQIPPRIVDTARRPGLLAGVQHGHQDAGRGRPTLGLRPKDAKPRHEEVCGRDAVRLDHQRHVQRLEHHDEHNLEGHQAGPEGEAHAPGQTASGLCVCHSSDATPRRQVLRAQTSETGQFVQREVHQGGGSQNQRGIHQVGQASVRLEVGDEWRDGASEAGHNPHEGRCSQTKSATGSIGM